MTRLRTADTSVVVPALATWHEHHDVAFAAVRDVRRLPAHVIAETLSVLSRLPGGLAQSLTLATQILAAAFPGKPLGLPGSGYATFAAALATAGLGGGAIYDGIVGATAQRHDALLLTSDDRALPAYAAVGADVEYLSPSG